MQIEQFHLKELYPFLCNNDCDPVLTVYAQDNSLEVFSGENTRPCMVVCPGGSYYAISERESEPIALELLPDGWQVAVLHYSVAGEVKGSWPQQLLEVAASMHLIRQNASKWHVDPERLAISGFSAGGHLAASYANYWNHPIVTQKVDAPRPKACVLAYAVLTADINKTHDGTIMYLSGKYDLKDLTEEEIIRYSMEKQVGEQTPPTFLFHTVSDDLVPIENALWYAEALSAHKIPFEVHIYPHGYHGLATANAQTGILDDFAAADWLRICKEWLRRTV